MKSLLATLSLLLLTACGYALPKLEREALYLRQAPPPLERALRQRAQALGWDWHPGAAWQLRWQDEGEGRQNWGLPGLADWRSWRGRAQVEALHHGQPRGSKAIRWRREWWEESASHLGHRAEEEDLQAAFWQAQADELMRFLWALQP